MLGKRIVKLMLPVMLVFALMACSQNTQVCQPCNDHPLIIALDLQEEPKLPQPKPEPVPVAKPTTYKINQRVLFDFDSYIIDAAADEIITKVAILMKAYPDTILKLEGHTDPHGSDRYNMILSINRANAVKDSLINKGVEEGRISGIKGFGESQLIPGATDHENRRVLILSVD